MEPVDRLADSGSGRSDPSDPSGPRRGEEPEWNALWNLYGTSTARGLWWTLVSIIAPKLILRKLHDR